MNPDQLKRLWEWTVLVLVVVIAISALGYMLASSGTIAR